MKGSLFMLHMQLQGDVALHYLGWANGGEREVQRRLDAYRRGDAPPVVQRVLATGGVVFPGGRWPFTHFDYPALQRIKKQPWLACLVCQSPPASDRVQ